MLKSVFCVSLALGAAMLVGCKDDETKTPAPPAVTPPAAPAVPAVPSTTQPSADVPAVPAVPATPAVTPPTAPTADAVDPEAKTLMDQVKDAIANKKWDDASAALKKLEAMKDKLPASWQAQLKDLQAAIDGGKLTSSIPGLPK